jgi:hypothetical protein
MDRAIGTTTGDISVARTDNPAYQGYQMLHWAFVVLPTITGLDKFAHLLTNWDRYLAPAVTRVLPMSGHAFMLIVGIVELVAALVVAITPRIGAYVVAAWLLGIMVNLLMLGGYLDVALRDFGLMLAALALARLSEVYDRPVPKQAK